MSKMIYIDDTEPEGDLEPAFPSRDVTIKRGVNAKELYEIIDEIGRGKFGTVYKCRERATGLTLAAKFVPIPKRDDRRNVEREVEIMNSLQHHLIIQLFAAYEFQKMMCVVLELVEGGELFDRVIEDEFVLSEKVCIVFIRQVCEAMEFIHRNNILHLDLKPENILCLTKEGNRIKVIDFGLARKYDPDKKLQILFGTPEFVAPEVVNFDCITYGTDMWSVGVICYVLISGISPFMGETDIQTMANVTIAKYDFDDESFNTVSPEALDFIAKLLVKDCSIRMTATQCLEHKWLSRRTRAPPLISPKPTNVPPLKLKTIPSPPQTPIPLDVNEDDEPKSVELPKDNIKNFIERWENHPNSPYVFDVESNVITPLRGDSISSSRVCSPSPCESVDSVQTEDGFKNTNNINNNNNNSIYDDNNFNSYGCDMLEPETPTNIDDATAIKLNNSRNFKDYLHSFDRRNSDTNYLLGRRPSGERMNLAEEIRKLSDHLLMLAEINTKMGTGGRTLPLNECGVAKAVKPSDEIKLNLLKANDKSSGNDKRSSTKIKQQNQQETLNENKEKPKKSTVKIKPFQSSLTSVSYSLSKGLTEDSKMASTKTTTVSKTTATTKANKTTTKTSTNLSKTVGSQYSRENTSTKNVSPTLASTSFSDKSKISSLSARLQKSIEEVPKILGIGLEKSDMSLITNRTTESSIITSTEKESSFPENITKTSSRIQSRINGFRLGLNPAFTSPTMFPSEASLKRMKFRVNSMSRDVPIGLPNTHQTVNLEEAANTTKDCLLHLLEKYNDTKMRNPSGRHQSISVDWNISDNLEYRTMSSINAFFQRNNSSSENVKHLQAQLTGKKKAT